MSQASNSGVARPTAVGTMLFSIAGPNCDATIAVLVNQNES
jgi:hypothetical protein